MKKLTKKHIFASLFFVCLTIIMIGKHKPYIKLGDSYYLEEFKSANMYLLYKSNTKSSENIIADGIIGYYETPKNYIAYGLAVKLCDIDSIYYIWSNKKIYYVIDKDSKNITSIKGDKNLREFKKHYNLDIETFIIPDNILSKINNYNSKDCKN